MSTKRTSPEGQVSARVVLRLSALAGRADALLGQLYTSTEDDSFPYRRWQRELALYWGSLTLAVLSVIAMFPTTVIGNILGGVRGRTIGAGVGLGIVAIFGCGMVIHFARFLFVRFYLLVMLHSWDSVDARLDAPEPGRVVRWLVTSRRSDFIVQMIGAAVIGFIVTVQHLKT